MVHCVFVTSALSSLLHISREVLTDRQLDKDLSAVVNHRYKIRNDIVNIAIVVK